MIYYIIYNNILEYTTFFEKRNIFIMGFREYVKDNLEPTKEELYSINRTKLVDGVYMRNHPIRKQMFKYIWAKYNMLPDVITDSLGKLYQISEELYMPDKNWKSLFDYTHDGSSMYSDYISRKYLNAGEYNTTYVMSNTPKDGYIKEPYTKEFISAINIGRDGRFIVNIDSNSTLNTYTPNLNRTYDENGFNAEGFKDTETTTTFGETFESISIDEKTSSRSRLLNKTAKLFNDRKVGTMISRFHTDKETIGDDFDKIEYIDSAKSTKYGNSHGRNLLKKGGAVDKINGYDDPYCRVWTHHKQYAKVSDLIRPFSDEVDIENKNILKQFRTEGGGDLLKSNSVLNRTNGFVNITPSRQRRGDVKKCMFSIENLAWKDVNKNFKNLSSEQKGPNGGRIMWFPPYDLSFQENVSVDWNENKFIGRGEPIYTYSNTRRSGTLNFTLLIDHPSIINGRFNHSEPSDWEGDLLRFFAGCDGLDDIERGLYTEALKTEMSKSEAENADILQGMEVGNEGNCEEVSFYVFFPNNYSGIHDKDAIDYLMGGYGATLSDEKKIGYEQSSTSISDGITKDNPNFEEYTIKSEVNGKASTNKDEWFVYRVDKNLRQKMKYTTSYRDSQSFSLNSTSGKFERRDKESTVSFSDIYNLLVKNKTNEKLKGLQDAIKNKQITSIEIVGGATNQDEPNSNSLAKNRSLTIKKWLEKYNISGKTTDTKEVVNLKDKTSVNSREAKEGRYVFVKINFNAPTVIENKSENRIVHKVEANDKVLVTGYTTREEDFGYSYINEGEYFSDLSKDNPFLFKEISSKIKYFSPAYHSITPEGFNSRLNFLHQCTRQGHTIEGTDDNGKTLQNVAGNLAFGRQPFCVLRIGDFINTKIIVRGFTITYENQGGMQWDLNPEGVGVQPMYAKVSMQIEIIGGQSLDAPISRLNNAVSFNYYANTGVYDHRADSAVYDDNGGIKYKKIWMPNDENVEKIKKIAIEQVTPESVKLKLKPNTGLTFN